MAMKDSMDLAQAPALQLARRLHAELAQSLSLALIELDQAAADGGSPPALQRARASLQAAQRELRQLIGGLCAPAVTAPPGWRPATAAGDLGAQLGRQVARLRHSQGRVLHYRVDGAEPSLAQPVQLALLDASQELLLNACKHGSPGPVALRLRHHAPHLSITVASPDAGPADRGPAPPAGPIPGLGMGLTLVGQSLGLIGARLRWRRGGGQLLARISWMRV